MKLNPKDLLQETKRRCWVICLRKFYSAMFRSMGVVGKGSENLLEETMSGIFIIHLQFIYLFLKSLIIMYLFQHSLISYFLFLTTLPPGLPPCLLLTHLNNRNVDVFGVEKCSLTQHGYNIAVAAAKDTFMQCFEAYKPHFT